MQKFAGKIFARATAVRSIATRFVADERGATSIEYGMIAGLISIAIAATLLAIGGTLRDDFYGLALEGLQSIFSGSGSTD
ncbi:Flp family type IVb pilin [Roseibium sp.]|uniref:Flp family type IVb pilin n=1 Tax=Roseibium sp. TaxID=1936156 RepID=UPI003A985682